MNTFSVLVNEIVKETKKSLVEIGKEEELHAMVTHWLLNKNIYSKCCDKNLIKNWEEIVLAFCVKNHVKMQDITSEIPFYIKGNKFSFIDLFAGIGGFNLALSRQGGTCLFSSEWDKSAKKTYFMNYGKYPFGDIHQFTDEDISDERLNLSIPDHDILAAGFPCQPFSNAGVSARNSLGLPHGFECETQGTLFHSIARIAYVKQPKIIFMENVRNLISHNGGETFNVIKTTMEHLAQKNKGKFNYKFYYSIINSETVVAQRRNRCYMVCIREDVWKLKGKKDFEFPAFDGESIPLRTVVEKTLPMESFSYTISDKLWQGHIERTKRNLDRKTGFTAFEADLNRPANTIVARYGKDGKECLIPQNGMNPRKLTIDECRQLFGYPDNFILPEARTPAYKQLGNSVVVPVVEALSKKIVEYLYAL